MSEMDQSGGQPRPWFARSQRPPQLMLYRVNRRPRAQLALDARPATPFLDHLVEALPFNEPLTTGRRYQRDWILANPETIDLGESGRRALSGRIGFTREDERATGEFDPEEGWHDVVIDVEEGIYAPFIVDADSRVLAVARHPGFSNPGTVAKVFQRLLERGESRLEGSTTDWAVEPILDETDFFSWIEKTLRVQRVRFVAQLPNPDAIEGHEWIDQRLSDLNADHIEETISTERPGGLRNLDEDVQAQAFVDSARQGFGYVTANGETARGQTRFDQRRNLASEPLPTVPGTWPALIAGMAGTLLRWLQDREDGRRVREEDE